MALCGADGERPAGLQTLGAANSWAALSTIRAHPCEVLRLEQSMALAHDDGRGEDHRQRKTEILQQVLAQAAQQAGRDRSPGAREAPERQAQSLHDADPDRIAGQYRG